MNVQPAGLLSLMYDIFRFSVVDSGLLCSLTLFVLAKKMAGLSFVFSRQLLLASFRVSEMDVEDSDV